MGGDSPLSLSNQGTTTTLNPLCEKELKMANRHDIYIWDAKIYGIKRDFGSIIKKARALAQQKAEPSASLLRFADTGHYPLNPTSFALTLP